MKRYDKVFKEEVVRLSDEIGPKKAAEQLGVAYYTLQEWRKRRNLTATEHTKEYLKQWNRKKDKELVDKYLEDFKVRFGI